MKVLVIEDELLIADNLIRMVKEIEPGVEILGPLVGVAESKAWLKKNGYPDLILSDIQLADGVSLDIFSTEEPGCPVIFTTAFNQYAIRAFKINSIDYLLKPVDAEELAQAFRKYHMLYSKYQDPSYKKGMGEMFRNFDRPAPFAEIFPVHVGRVVVIIRKNEVSAFVKEEIIFLVNHEGRKFITDFRSLDEVEELLEPELFYRANRQYLVNINAIESYRTDSSFKILLKLKNSQEDISISKEKAAEFKAWIKKS
jgi:two-component system, LytTR family, response regulator